MNILIVEDEPHVAAHLQMQLSIVAPEVIVLYVADSVSIAVNWLHEHKPDLILMDIRLGDELSFNIFEKVAVPAPVIFITAYDQYALKAFDHHGIAYLLKPVDKYALATALQKWHSMQRLAMEQLRLTMSMIKEPAPVFRERFLVTEAGRIKSISAERVAWFLSEGRYTKLMDLDGGFYLIDDTMEKLQNSLNPVHFFRINRQFIINYAAIGKMHVWSKSRLKLDLLPPSDQEAVVSSERAASFKDWLNR